MKKLADLLISEESGQGMVEYALILVVVAAGMVVVLGQMKGKLEVLFNKVVSGLAEANSGN